MAEVLYRKYRARSFSEIIGQNEIVETLKQSVLQDRISHSYLFTGARGTGKTSIARIFAKAINCTNFSKNNDSCNECNNCLAIASMQTTDVVEMDAASNRGVDEIRDMKSTVDFVPTMLRKKIYIIDEAHMLTKEAFNALLKTLEEPPEHVVFMFATTEPHKLPITILSRVQRYDFGLGTLEEVKSKLKLICSNEGVEITDDVLEVIYKKSGGSYRDAESLLGKVLVMNANNKVTMESVYKILGLISDEDINSLMRFLLEKDLSKSLEITESITQNGGDLNFLIDQLLDKLREELLENASNKAKLSKLMQLTSQLIISKREMKEFPNKRTVFEIALIRICGDGISVVQTASPEVKNEKNDGIRELEKKKEVSSPNIIKEETPIYNAESTISDIKSHLVGRSGSISARFKALLNSSNIEIDGVKVKIITGSKFNITFLNKPDHVKFILINAKEVSNTIDEVEFVLGETQIEETKVSNIQYHEVKEEKVEIDNSELIANLL